MKIAFSRLIGGAALVGALVSAANGQTVAPEFSSTFRVRDIGKVGFDLSVGGIAFKPGSPNTLLFRTSAGDGTQNKILQITVTRDASGRMSGFIGSASSYANSPSQNGVTGAADGSLAFTADGVLLYTSLNDVTLAEIKAGATSPSKIVTDESGLAFGGGLAMVPAGLPNAGHLKVVAVDWQEASLTPDGNGTYDLAPTGTPIEVGVDLYGIAFATAGQPGFAKNSILGVEQGSNRIHVFDADAKSDPIPATRRNFVTDLPNGVGLTVDPVTGDFIASNGGGNIFVIGRFAVDPPTVRITNPTGGATLSAPANVSLKAEASQVNGSIAKVDFYLNEALVGSDTSNPYDVFVERLMPGTYNVRAVATDSGGASATSSPVTFTVVNLAPTVRLASPTAGQIFPACSTLSMRAEGSDPEDTTLTAVEFYNGETFLGRDTTQPFEWNIPRAVPGTFTLKAIAIDSLGAKTTSTTVTVTVLGPALNHLVGGMNAGSFHVCFNGEPGVDYIFEATPSLKPGEVNWSTIGMGRAVPGSLLEAVDSTGANRFYRARRAP